jgi:DNA-binding Lrp family transcriptional regulator
VSDYSYCFPNFHLYDSANRVWSFEWDAWTEQIKEKRREKAFHDPQRFRTDADRTDLLILAELEINARAKFSDISKVVGVTLQAVKHRYDKRIVPRGLIRDFVINVIPYPLELSDLYEVLLAFEDEESMNAFFGASEEMIPFQRTMKVLGDNKLSVRTYTPRNETERLFEMLSSLARHGLIADYSAVRIRPESQNWQTISFELFEDKAGWKYESSQHFATLDSIVEHTKVKA